MDFDFGFTGTFLITKFDFGFQGQLYLGKLDFEFLGTSFIGKFDFGFQGQQDLDQEQSAGSRPGAPGTGRQTDR